MFLYRENLKNKGLIDRLSDYSDKQLDNVINN